MSQKIIITSESFALGSNPEEETFTVPKSGSGANIESS
jgi:hypothetical protein